MVFWRLTYFDYGFFIIETKIEKNPVYLNFLDHGPSRRLGLSLSKFKPCLCSKILNFHKKSIFVEGISILIAN